MDPDCIFCKIIAGEIPCFKLFEDEQTFAFMDINPAHDGHSLIIPKVHVEDLFAIEPETIAAVAQTARRVGRAVQRTLSPAGMNLMQCNGEAAGQSVFHFHMHVIPRAVDDELKMNWGLVPGDMDAIGALAERIRGNIEA